MRASAYILCFALWSIQQTLVAADWPIFRGTPNLSGVSSAQLPDKPVRLWAFKTDGPVKSSATISQNRVFIGSTDSNLYALDFDSGKKLWNFKTTDAVNAPPL